MPTLSEFLLEKYCCDPTHKVTLTSRSSSGLGRQQSKFSAANLATHKFLHRLDSLCFGHGHRLKGLLLDALQQLRALGPLKTGTFTWLCERLPG